MTYIKGVVISGDRYGRKLGYPTANISWRTLAGKRVAAGVYIGSAAVGDTVYRALVIIGVRSTKIAPGRKVEIHLLKFRGNLYGRVMTVALRTKIRPLVRFTDTSELIRQIKRDIAVAREYFRRHRT